MEGIRGPTAGAGAGAGAGGQRGRGLFALLRPLLLLLVAVVGGVRGNDHHDSRMRSHMFRPPFNEVQVDGKRLAST
jgi:hypothetical protein